MELEETKAEVSHAFKARDGTVCGVSFLTCHCSKLEGRWELRPKMGIENRNTPCVDNVSIALIMAELQSRLPVYLTAIPENELVECLMPGVCHCGGCLAATGKCQRTDT